MRRHSPKKKYAEVELFPFLSILACTIGTLILLIIVLTTQALNKQEVIIVAREGNGVNASKTPFYLECRSTGVVIYPGKEFVPRDRLGNADSALQQLLNTVTKNRDRNYIILALRPNAIDTFNQVRDIIEQANAQLPPGNKIDIGYEPVDANWTLKTEELTEINNQTTAND